VRSSEPGRRLDLLLMAALIEARSAERFRLLLPVLPPALLPLYTRLAQSEARHFLVYLGLARTAAPAQWRARLNQLAAQEAQLAVRPDPQLRFHSGAPLRAFAPPG
jgi:tRNA-(ms[2]io[6]A)-hydroxylase